jgi:hypothetical protein
VSVCHSKRIYGPTIVSASIEPHIYKEELVGRS